MLTRRKLKDRIAELEENYEKAMQTARCHHSMQTGIIMFLDGISKEIGVPLEDNQGPPEDEVDQFKMTNEQIRERMFSYPPFVALKNRILELKAKAEKASADDIVLKPCPCCDHKDILFGEYGSNHWLYCNACKMQGAERETVPLAIKCWNNLPRRTNL